MKFEFQIAKKTVNKSTSKNPIWTNPGVLVDKTVDWSGESQIVSLTPADMAALQRKHGTQRVNYPRATEVKRMMVYGLKQAAIIQILSKRGRGFGERMIKADHAALSAPLRKASKKVQ